MRNLLLGILLVSGCGGDDSGGNDPNQIESQFVCGETPEMLENPEAGLSMRGLFMTVVVFGSGDAYVSCQASTVSTVEGAIFVNNASQGLFFPAESSAAIDGVFPCPAGAITMTYGVRSNAVTANAEVEGKPLGASAICQQTYPAE